MSFFKNLLSNSVIINPSIISIEDISNNTIIDANTALTIGAFYQGVNSISNTIASLPFKVFQNKEIQKKNPIHYIIKEKSNDLQTAFEFFNTMIFIMFLKGNSFAKIVRGITGDVEQLIIINYSTVEPIIFNNRLYFKFDKGESIPNEDLIHFKNIGTGFLGIDPISNFRKNIEINLNATSYTNQVYTGEASSIKGSITYDKALNDQQRDRLRNELSTKFSGKNGKKILFLEDGMKLDNINLSPEQTKFLESRQFEKSEVASMLNVPPFIVGDYSTTYSNIELQNLHFYKQTLLPIITKIESELKHKLFTKDEILDGFYVKANVEAVLRGDSKSRAEYYKELFYLGSITPKEIRDKEDLPTEYNGEAYIHSNLIPLGISGEFWTGKVNKDLAKAELDESKT
ncbi:phage portal protein [Cyclobacterium plantarum]|uniref:Phage portal protein n=1 Tax=Cyclobacterium plantarum TaxID=2716263 RepID=A0ABX0HC83_9BACT|nr:phage portal protein [Cyclobacterium plantarum]NHE57963.1 phage portal protein [Cyclobacterium plantarum]